uniref:TFIIS central domain-containing protein n=1 Tax=Vombatus ursinus TaxID=29139 RepID=A0A4X2JSN0_VOMUR
MTTPLPVTKEVIPSTSASVTGKETSTLPRNIVPKKSPSFTNASVTKKATNKSPGDFKGVIPKKSWLSGNLTGSVSSTKQSVLVSASTASTSKKLHVSSTLAGGPRKPVPPSTSPASSSTPGKSGATSSQSQPISQIRQNIRRSLKEILWKRVNDSNDLIMTENEVGKIALRIEKEMFNLFQVTDNRYKGTYRSIMLNLKDPKNQGLFHRVLREEISLAKLVRMKPEELASKELSMWKEKPTKFMIESKNKLQTGSKKSAMKQEARPDMDNSPPVSDSDGKKLARAVPEKSGAPLLDVFSSILQDTTSQHRAHLFDLNCKICTGQVPSSEDEPAPKKPKLSAPVKKVKSKSKSGSSGSGSVSRPVSRPADDLVSEAIAESTSEPEVESIPQMNLERSYFLIPLERGNAEPSSVKESSLYPNSCSAGVVTTVTISGRDPRTARRSSAATSTSATRPSSGLQTNKLWTGETKRETLKPVLTPTVVPESISTSFVRDPRYLPVPPSPNINIPGTRYPQERDTSLSHLSTIWKGFINMQSVVKFVAKAYPVSGCFDYLSEELPDTMHIGGRISPRAVWDYVGKVKSSVSKELCLIRFHPATEEEEVAYISLYSYFSSRGYFGVVANNNRHIRDLYLIPLCAQDPIPSKLLPFEGPGKHRISGWLIGTLNSSRIPLLIFNQLERR